MYVLGINESHTSTAAILKDGEIIACASEERFVRKKSISGFPKNAINFCLETASVNPSQIDLVVFGFKNPGFFLPEFEKIKSKSFLGQALSNILMYMNKLISEFSISIPISFYRILEYSYNIMYRYFVEPKLHSLHVSFLENELKIKSDKFFFLDHHLAHAFAPYYMYKREKDKKYLVITNDGYGDQVCGRVFVVVNNIWKEIANTSNSNSLGWVYAYTTQMLGFKPAEHEYKVMGLAPYSFKEGIEKTYPVFRKLIWLDNLIFKSKIPRLGYFSYLKKNLSGIRFDYVAAGVQKLTEDLLVAQINNAISKTGIRNIVVGGGVFMNVKANMEISTLSRIAEYSVMPSAGDESTAIGACYFGYKKMCEKQGANFQPQVLTNLYLGPSFTQGEIEKAFMSEKIKNNPTYKIEKMSNSSKTIAGLLSKGKIIARFSGRMEFGARALGNRSILANPSDLRVVKIINDLIKGRDFWMPFAPVVLRERMSDYFYIPKTKVTNEYMMIAYKTKLLAQKELIAGLHQYDFTARPQVISEEGDKLYYEIVKEFEKITGIGGLLNTSFNIHGDPIVCTPVDAIRTLKNSGLEYLAIENYLVIKRK